MKIVFDTFAWIEFFEGTKKGEIVRSYIKENKILTPSIVLLELSCKADKEGWDFQKHLSFIKINSEIIGINEKFALTFGRLYNKIKKQVKEISLADVIILHSAEINDAKLLSGDKHFKNIERAILL